MDKFQLQSVIQKYHINGLVEQALWEVQDGEININFMTPARDVIGHLVQKNIKLPNSEIAIYSTSQLLKLINILSKDIILDLEQTNSVYTKLNIQDTEYILYFTLANPMVIESVGKVKEPTEYDVTVALTQENVLSFIKARNALSKETVNVKITTIKDSEGVDLLQFEVGNLSNYSNKIVFSIPAFVSNPINAVFNSDIIRDIFQVNKDMTKGFIYIKNEGLMKLEFASEETQVKYFTIKNS